MKKTYTSLLTLKTGTRPGEVQIKMCASMLENHCQCWRPGDFLVTNTENEETYQLCRRHAQAEAAAQLAAERMKEATEKLEQEALPIPASKPLIQPQSQTDKS